MFWIKVKPIQMKPIQMKPIQMKGFFHLSPTVNILSQKTQPLQRSNHFGPPK